MRLIKTFYVTPMGKPRMTQRDRWHKRPVTDRYWSFKASLLSQAGDFDMPLSGYRMIFYIPMPKYWSKKRRAMHVGGPHMAKPDKDNLEKAVLDALLDEDSVVWDGRTTKRWTDDKEGRIEIYLGEEAA